MTTDPTALSDLPPRSQWGRCLLAVPAAEVEALARSLADRFTVSHHQRPQEGLTMLQMREPNRGEAFFLGELPTASAAVSLRNEQGSTALGGVCFMHHDQGFAVAAAIIDAVVAADWPGSTDAVALLRRGQEAVAKEARIRAAMLARTTVDFALLESDEEENDDD